MTRRRVIKQLSLPKIISRRGDDAIRTELRCDDVSVSLDSMWSRCVLGQSQVGAGFVVEELKRQDRARAAAIAAAIARCELQRQSLEEERDEYLGQIAGWSAAAKACHNLKIQVSNSAPLRTERT